MILQLLPVALVSCVLVTKLTLLLKLVNQLTVIQWLSLGWQANHYFLSTLNRPRFSFYKPNYKVLLIRMLWHLLKVAAVTTLSRGVW